MRVQWRYPLERTVPVFHTYPCKPLKVVCHWYDDTLICWRDDTWWHWYWHINMVCWYRLIIANFFWGSCDLGSSRKVLMAPNVVWSSIWQGLEQPPHSRVVHPSCPHLTTPLDPPSILAGIKSEKQNETQRKFAEKIRVSIWNKYFKWMSEGGPLIPQHWQPLPLMKIASL